MDLSKALDCVPHDLIIAKLAAYGFDSNSLQYILSYLIFINDLFLFVEKNKLHNYADYSTISSFSNSISNLTKTLESESINPIKCI